MKRLSTIVLITLLSLSLTGCMGREPNEIAYVVALGIDSEENGNYKITIQYANPTNISGGEEGSKSEGDVVENLVLEAPNIYSAVGLANQIDSKNFSLSHTKLVVFSQEIAEQGLKDLTEIFTRSEELRPDVYLAVAAGSAGEYLEAVNPVMEINPAKYYQLIFDKNNMIGLPEGIEKNFFFGVETGDYDSLLPLAGVVKKGEAEEGEEDSGKSSDNGGQTKSNEKLQEAPLNEDAFEYKMRDYIAGQNAIALKTKSEAMGSAIFKGDKMVGVLGSIETELYKLLDNDYNYSYLTLYNEKTPEKPITVKATQKKSPKYNIDDENKQIQVMVFLEGDIYSIPSGYNIDEDLDSFEQNSEKYISEACEKFMNKILKDYESDIFRFNERSKSKFITNDAYEEYKKHADYSDFDIKVTVDFDVRRTGLVIREG